MVPQDLYFIFSSWLHSYRKGCRFVRDLDWDVYRVGQANLIQSLLLTSDVLVACNPDSSDQIFGYIVFTETPVITAIHWVYVKATFRRFGVARSLYKEALSGTAHDINGTVYATHTNHHWGWIKQKIDITHNPYLIHEVSHVKAAPEQRAN